MQPWFGAGGDRRGHRGHRVRLGGAGSPGRRVRGGVRRGHAGRARRRGVVSCTTALHLALVVAGVQAGRRRRRPVVLVHRHRERARVRRCSSGVRRRRPRHRQPHRGDGRGGAHRRPPARSSSSTRAASRSTSTRSGAVRPARHRRHRGRGLRRRLDLPRPARSVPARTIAAWSFHPRKIVTTGEGGMLTTSHAEWADRARRLREHAMSVSAAARHASVLAPPEEYLEVGFNYRMTDLQAAVGLVQLGRLPEVVARRREIAGDLRQADRRDRRACARWRTRSGAPRNFQSFWVEVGPEFPLDRDGLLAHLADGGDLRAPRHHGDAPPARLRGGRRTRRCRSPSTSPTTP